MNVVRFTGVGIGCLPDIALTHAAEPAVTRVVGACFDDLTENAELCHEIYGKKSYAITVDLSVNGKRMRKTAIIVPDAETARLRVFGYLDTIADKPGTNYDDVVRRWTIDMMRI